MCILLKSNQYWGKRSGTVTMTEPRQYIFHQPSWGKTKGGGGTRPKTMAKMLVEQARARGYINGIPLKNGKTR